MSDGRITYGVTGSCVYYDSTLNHIFVGTQSMPLGVFVAEVHKHPECSLSDHMAIWKATPEEIQQKMIEVYPNAVQVRTNNYKESALYHQTGLNDVLYSQIVIEATENFLNKNAPSKIVIEIDEAVYISEGDRVVFEGKWTENYELTAKRTITQAELTNYLSSTGKSNPSVDDIKQWIEDGWFERTSQATRLEFNGTCVEVITGN
jgi:hypothetical protein